MRRILSLILVFLFVPLFAFADFSDIPETHWAYEFIAEMKKDGIVDGYEDGTFRPEGFVTRAETARILCDIASLPEGDTVYKDVSEELWYYTYARDCGKYIESCEKFLGDELMTREGLADAVVQILGLKPEDTSSAEHFTDYESFKKPSSIAAAVDAGFVSGYGDNSFRPEGNITRAEVCSMLVRAFNSDDTDDNAEPAEESWTVKKLVNAELENFRLNAVLTEKGKLVFIQPEEEDELVFGVDLPKGETSWETMWRMPRFVLRTDENDDNAGYTGFIPHSVFFDNGSNKTHLFGRFTTYTASDKNTYDVNKYIDLDLTYSLIKYAEFEEGKVQYNDNTDYTPQLLYIHDEKYTVVYDGKSSVYLFDVEEGRRDGKMYSGNENTFRGFLSIGEKLFGMDKSFNLAEYDFDKMEWKQAICSFDADVMGMRKNKFWLWNKEEGTIVTSSPDGKTETVHDNVKPENINAEDGIDLSVVDSYMLVYDENTFILYDGTAFLMLEKNVQQEN